jgi:hypothetical protein
MAEVVLNTEMAVGYTRDLSDLTVEQWVSLLPTLVYRFVDKYPNAKLAAQILRSPLMEALEE